MVSPCNCPGQYWKGSDERTFPSVSHLQVGEGCSVAVRKIYLYIVCGTPIPPPSLICRGENVGTNHYKYSRASLVVQHRACAPYPSPPPVFCDLSSFLYKAFYNPCAGGNAPHAWHWLHFLWILPNRTLPDRRKRDPRSWQNVAHLDGLCVDCSVIVYCRAQIDNQMFIWSFQNVSK